MAKRPDIHQYSDRAAFDRIMLLIGAIAHHPGIAPQSAGISPMVALLEAMREIAVQQGIEWQQWSEATIRKDLVTLRRYGLLPAGTAIRSGYWLGCDRPLPPPKPIRVTKSKLSAEAIVQLRREGKSLAEVARMAGVSRERVRQIEQRYRTSGG